MRRAHTLMSCLAGILRYCYAAQIGIRDMYDINKYSWHGTKSSWTNFERVRVT